MNELKLEELLEVEFKKLYERYWSNILKKNYEEIKNKRYHRTVIIDIPNIQKIKNTLIEKIGYIPIYVFLTSFCNNYYFPGPHKNIDKLLLVLYQLVEGYSTHQMDDFINDTTFYRIYEKLYIKNEKYLDNWINDMYKNYFSNLNIRLLTSYIKNPDLLKQCTLIMDGHHNRITYENIDFNNKDLYSWKLKKNGLNTQIIIDNNNMVLYVSDSLPCKNNNDDVMFMNNVRLNDFLKYGDCLCFDGLYTNTLDAVISKYNNIEFNLNEDNFIFPIRKQKKIDLNKDEEIFNYQLAGYRSRIETYFSEISKTFKRFDPYKNIRVTKLKTYNLQLKLVCLLLNIKKFVELGNIAPTDLHKKWADDDFDYPEEAVNIISNTVTYKLENIKKIRDFQSDIFLKLNIVDSNNNLNNKLVNTNNNIDIDNDINMDEKDNHYEVSYIIKHRKNEDESTDYYVKWKGYNKNTNSWVKETDFNSNTLIDLYWNTLN